MDINRVFRAAAGLTLRETAMKLASTGIPVFPCSVGAKRPLTEHGFHDAGTEAGQVRRWWTRWPEANIGIPTGAVSGIEVLDVDVHRTGSGYSALVVPRRDGMVDGWAMLVRTPSGGLHAYYPADPARAQRSWQVPSAHVDFRGDGGYIIAPPSRVRVGGGLRAYRALAAGDHHAPIDANALRGFLEPPRPRVASFPDRSAPSDVELQRLARWVSARGAGERNRALFWAACRVAEANVPHDDALAVLGAAAEEIGLSAREAMTTIRSAYRTALPHVSGSEPASHRLGELPTWGMTPTPPHRMHGTFGL